MKLIAKLIGERNVVRAAFMTPVRRPPSMSQQNGRHECGPYHGEHLKFRHACRSETGVMNAGTTCGALRNGVSCHTNGDDAYIIEATTIEGGLHKLGA